MENNLRKKKSPLRRSANHMKFSKSLLTLAPVSCKIQVQKIVKRKAFTKLQVYYKRLAKNCQSYF